MFSRLMAKWARGRFAKVERRLREAVCQPLEERLLLAKTIYVDVNSPSPATNGPTWSTAYKDLQLALGAAVSGDTIKVADGTYKPTSGSDRSVSFQLKNSVGMYGGYAGFGAAEPDKRDIVANPSILSGDIGAIGSNADNSYHVVIGSGTNGTAVLDGFAITGGNANDISPNRYGGGMYNSSGSPTLANCTFSGNTGYFGGGIYDTSSSNPTLTNCTFSGNSATSVGYGGGMYNTSSNPTLANCTFSGNSASSDGGGIYNSSSSPTLTNCTFSRNTATGTGGGMSDGSSSSPALTNCTFGGNTSISSGGGLYNATSSNPTLINCTFSGNTGSSGGGMHNSSSSPKLTNCTFSGNTAASSGGGVYNTSAATLSNCILWGNTASSNSQISGSATVSYSDIQGNFSGTGNINADPLFVRNPSAGADAKWGTADDDYGDLRLRLISPGIDAGNNAAVPSSITTDLAGNPRWQNIVSVTDTGAGTAPIVDMGAYEATPGPLAAAGGPYMVMENGSAILSGLGYSDRGLSLSYAWDFNADGVYNDATGPNPTFSAAGILGSQTRVISLRVTDSFGTDVFDAATVYIVRPIYVDDTAAGANNGTSWTDAYQSLQTALATVAAGQTIVVGQGTYRPTTIGTRTASFTLVKRVTILGSYAGVGSPDPNARNVTGNPSILSGDIGTVTDNSDNSFHVVSGSYTDATAILDGFTITAGNAGSDFGGGMYNQSGSPTLRNCTFIGNTAYCGGGMYNSASSPILTNCTFNGNSASRSGGGMYSQSSSSPTLANCTFSGNTGDSGGGMYNNDGSPKLTNCTFSQNLAAGVARCGSELYNGYASTTLTNCVLWGDYSAIGLERLQPNGSLTVTYSDIKGGFAGAGNIDADPLFARNPSPGADGKWGTSDDDYGDLQLQAPSPVADAGDNTAAGLAGITTDFGGNPRFADIATTVDTGVGSSPVVDMGAYEAIPALAASPGGPYVGIQGRDVRLSGRGASTVAGALQYEWEWTGDGKFDDGTGSNPLLATATLPLFSEVAVSLRVTDSASRSIISTTTVRILPPVFYVDDGATGTNNGTSWNNAFVSLATALKQAVPGQELRVAGGTYNPTSTTDRTSSFWLKSGVSLVGGYAGYGAGNPDTRDTVLYVSILSGDIGATGDRADNSYHVVVGSGTDNTAVLDGFTITAGTAYGIASDDYDGGGMYSYSGSPTIRNCMFIGNTARSYGGGLCNESRSSPTLTNCTFSGNLATWGGGMDNEFYSSPMLTNCTVSANTATDLNGGGIYSSLSSPVLTNCIVWGNVSATGSQLLQSAGSLTVTYSDIQGGFSGQGNVNLDPLFVRNPDPGADGKWSTGDDDYGDLRLQVPSPAADAGNNTAAGLAGMTTDLAGNPRFTDIATAVDGGLGSAPIVDMGAYEAIPALAASPGGPYVGIQGRDLRLSGRGASTVPGDMQYAWEWTGDGKFDDATGTNPLFPTSIWPLMSSVTVSLRVIDSASRSTISTTTVMILPPVFYVDRSVTGANNGLSWTNAFDSLATALKQAVAGQEIHVAGGTYKPTSTTDRTVSFQLKNGVSLLGGYAGHIAGNPDARDILLYPTLLSGDIGTTGNNIDNSYHVVVGNGTDATAIMDGFTITAGNANGGSSPDVYGGGMYTLGSSPSLVNCTFSGNTAIGGGGGLYNDQSSPTLTNCAFQGNSATNPPGSRPGNGGGMYNELSSPRLSGCTFIGNTATVDGGGLYQIGSSSSLSNCMFIANSAIVRGGGAYIGNGAPTFSNCTFSANMATGVSGSGGGMYISSTPTLTNCTFSGNTAAGSSSSGEYGGGGVCDHSSSSHTFSNCTFIGNKATGATGCGGGMYNVNGSPTLTNCTFFGNTATGASGSGGGMYNYNYAYARLTNCLFSGNSAAGASGSGGGMYNGSYAAPILTNVTFSGNTAYTGGAMYDSSASPRLTNCILWGNTATSLPQIYQSGGSIMVSYSDIQQASGVYAGTGNVNADPLFVRSPYAGTDGKWGTADDDYGDVRPQLNSPVIDAGNNAAVPTGITTDLAGKPRFLDMPGVADTGLGTAPIVDMGAYERGLAVTTTGASGNGQFSFGLTADQGTLQIWSGSSLQAGPTASYAVNTVESCEFVGGGGDDTLTIDVSNGLPTIGLTFTGGAGKDTLMVTGTTTASSLQVLAGQVVVGTVAVACANVEAIQLDGTSGGVVNVGSLTVGTNLGMVAGKNLVLRTGSLNITAGGTLDLAGNSMILDYTASPMAQVRGWLANGRMGSTPAIKGSAGLGMVDNALVHLNSFAGQSLGGFGQILIQATVAGDTNLDGKVDQADYLNIIANMGRTNSQWFLGDLNHDGVVTTDDLAEVTANFGMGAAFAAGPGLLVAAVSAKAVAGKAVAKKMVQGVKSSKVQRSKSSKAVQKFKGSKVQGFKSSRG